MNDYSRDIKDYFLELINTINKLNLDEINKVIELLDETTEKGKKIYICGNGGSASTASHFQADFEKLVSVITNKRFQVDCLNDNVPTIMAIANDIGYDKIFTYQLEGRLQEGDIVIAISGSGNSKNVINAVKYAREHKNKVIGITGFDGGMLMQITDICLHVPCNNMQISEDIHLIFNHMMVTVLAKKKYCIYNCADASCSK